VCRQEVVNFSLFVDKTVDKREDTALALREVSSDNLLEQAQFNTVVVQQKEMDRVGVEPTTSAAAELVDHYY
jgi:hypothetical protein